MKISYKQATVILISISTLFRIFLGSQLEFGNDEVYYWLYAKYPDISHFDHPPFVGFFIQLFTVNLWFDSELAIRLAAIIPASITMYLIFLIGKQLKDERLGFIAVLLYNISVYGFIISGLFILPDAPLLFFWVLSFYFLLQGLPYEPSTTTRKKILWAFVGIGCAIYSKYQAVFLLLGVSLYILCFNRKWLKDWSLYVGLLVPILAVSLIFYWNYQNDFISYKFHNNRVSLFSLSFNKNSFIRELLGQCLYNNPYIFILVIAMLVSFFRKKFVLPTRIAWLFLFISLPLIVTTIYISLSRDTLPHWSGVSYITLLPLVGLFIYQRKNIVRNLMITALVLVSIYTLASFVINQGWFLPVKTEESKELTGRNDALMDMYGWKQTSEQVSEFIQQKELNHLPIISDKWFPAAHIDYYIARPNQMKVYGIGELPNIHKYYWINKIYPDIANEKEFLYLTDSRNFRDPQMVYTHTYKRYELLQTFPVVRNDQVVKYVFLYKLGKDF